MHKVALPPELTIDANVLAALEEDIGRQDVTSELIPEDLNITVKIIAREPILICGQPWVDKVFAVLDRNIKVNWNYVEGTILETPQTICSISGNARKIFSGERTALNFLQTLSATASNAYQYVQKLKDFHTKLLDTRKTLPGLRLAQKYAVRLAGGINHRLGLYDVFLIKENHIKACGSITKAINRAKKLYPELFITVEVENLEEFAEARNAKPNRILLDNFSFDMLHEAVALNDPKMCELEASGNINFSNIVEYAKTNVDYVSVGAITKSIKAVDLSLLVEDY